VTKITRRTVPNFLDHQQPVDAVVRPKISGNSVINYQAMLPLNS